jgi:hypothetical protein
MTTQNDLTEQLMQALRTSYEARSADSEVDPAVLASDAVFALDPGGASPLLVQWGCVLELRQLARSICRERLLTGAEKQATLFGDLQARYPAMRRGNEVYVLREDMTLAERHRMIARLRKEATAKWSHAESLEAETKFLEEAGWFESQKQ